MDLGTAILLGFFQGLFEWLPVSSEGATVILNTLLGGNISDSIDISIFLHLGTVFSAIIFYRKEVIEIVTLKDKNMLKFLIIATTITLAIGVPLYFTLKEISEAIGIFFIAIVGVALLITGILQILSRKKLENAESDGNESEIGIRETYTLKDAIFGGIGQGFSIIPGISRSGTTTSVFFFRKLGQNSALKLSFLMSIPVILIANVGLAFLSNSNINFSVEAIAGLITAFIVGLVTIKALTMLAAKVNFGMFVIIMGVLAIIPVIFIVFFL